MISEPPTGLAETTEQAHVDTIVGNGPAGAFALAGTAVILVMAMWCAFYLLVFSPRT